MYGESISLLYILSREEGLCREEEEEEEEESIFMGPLLLRGRGVLRKVSTDRSVSLVDRSRHTYSTLFTLLYINLGILV